MKARPGPRILIPTRPAEMMVHVVNKSQQVVTRSLNPKTEYSRLIGLSVAAAAGAGEVIQISAKMGTDIWLNHIWVQHRPREASVNDGVGVLLLAGSGETTNIGARENWEPVIRVPRYEGAVPGIIMCDGLNALSWSINKLYRGESRRFAVVAQRFGVGDDAVQIQFEISEG